MCHSSGGLKIRKVARERKKERKKERKEDRQTEQTDTRTDIPTSLHKLWCQWPIDETVVVLDGFTV